MRESRYLHAVFSTSVPAALSHALWIGNRLVHRASLEVTTGRREKFLLLPGIELLSSIP
jgi:hypothetical protein